MRVRSVLALLFVVVAASSLAAQDIYFLRRAAGYGALGFGGGNFKLTCTGCTGNSLSGGGANLYLGHHFSRRWRPELGFFVQSNRNVGSNMFGASLGATVYLVGQLHVRGGVSYLVPNFDDSAGNFKGHGVGFTVGGGYDLYLSHGFALSPFVNYASASITKLTRTQVGGATSVVTGHANSLHFGVALSWIKVKYFCRTANGTFIGQGEYGFRACLDAVTERVEKEQ